MKTLPEALRDLPPLDPPPDAWQKLSARLDARAPRRAHRALHWGGGLALAASLLLAVLAPSLLPVPAGPSPAVHPDDPLAGLIEQSQALEQRLSRLKSQAGVWHGGLALDAAALQHDVALLDEQLSELAFRAEADPRAAERLWGRRIELLNRLVSAHAAPSLIRTTPTVATAAAEPAEFLEL